MGRTFVEAVGLFVLPFAVYLLLLVLRRRYPFLTTHWPGERLAVLVVAGLLLAIVGIVTTGLFGPRHRGAYVPAHIENGRLVPGRME